MSSYVTATFKTRPAAEEALRALEKMGITEEQLGLVVTDKTRGSTFNIETETQAEEGVAIGAMTGGVIGAVIGGLGTATAMVIPGVNILFSGVLVSAFAGLGAGATAGGLFGALAGLGMKEHEARIVEGEVKNGAVLLAVKPKDDEQKKKIKEVLERQDAYNLAA